MLPAQPTSSSLILLHCYYLVNATTLWISSQPTIFSSSPPPRFLLLCSHNYSPEHLRLSSNILSLCSPSRMRNRGGSCLIFLVAHLYKKKSKMKLPKSTTFGYCPMQVVKRASKVNSISIPTKRF